MTPPPLHEVKLELSSDLLMGIISVALVLPLGSVLRAPGAWALAGLCALLAALLWEELSAPPLRRLAVALRRSLQTLPISIPGRSRLQRLRRWVRSFPGEVLFLLLESLASSTWPAIVTICIMAPVHSDMLSPRINLQQLLQVIRMIGKATGVKKLVRKCRQWRQPSRRQGINEDTGMELPRRRQGPWQS
jgi:hypothetical protein